MITKIQVTEKDILSGIKFSCVNCPIAKALDRTVPGLDLAVGAVELYHKARISGKVSPQKYPLSSSVSDWVASFDKGDAVHPFEFEIDLPSVEELKQTIDTQEVKEDRKSKEKEQTI